MPNLILFDTSNESCAVGLYFRGQLLQSVVDIPRQHAKVLLPNLQALLTEAGASLQAIDAIACSVGPGAFTGIRIAVAATQSLALAIEKPCIAINTLAALAQKATIQKPDVSRWLVAQDARMQKVYCQWYQVSDQHRLKAITEPQEMNPETISASAESYGIIGTAIDVYDEQLPLAAAKERLGGKQAIITAEDMLPLALEAFNSNRLTAYHDLLPLYVRNNVAVKSRERAGLG